MSRFESPELSARLRRLDDRIDAAAGELAAFLADFGKPDPHREGLGEMLGMPSVAAVRSLPTMRREARDDECAIKAAQAAQRGDIEAVLIWTLLTSGRAIIAEEVDTLLGCIEG